MFIFTLFNIEHHSTMPIYSPIRCTRFSLFLIFTLFSISKLSAQNKLEEAGFKYQENYYYLMNKNGETKKGIEPYSYAEPFNEGLALVAKNLTFGYIDTTGTVILGFDYIDAGSFHNGFAYASLGENYGYINTKGEFVIEPIFERVGDFNGGYARIYKRNTNPDKYGQRRWIEGVINKKGKLVENRYFDWLVFNKDSIIEGIINDSTYILTNGKFIYNEEETQLNNLSQNKTDVILPSFKDGEFGLASYVRTQTRYPISAFLNGISSRCFIKFAVDEDGNIFDVTPADLGPPILLKEGVRLVKSMPQWIPGSINGRTIKVGFTIPINFVAN